MSTRPSVGIHIHPLPSPFRGYQQGRAERLHEPEAEQDCCRSQKPQRRRSPAQAVSVLVLVRATDGCRGRETQLSLFRGVAHIGCQCSSRWPCTHTQHTGNTDGTQLEQNQDMLLVDRGRGLKGVRGERGCGCDLTTLSAL